MALLEACRLSKRFGGLQAFRDIDLTLAEGEILGLIGPNGSGKTTFFNAITGLHPATGGQILFADGQHELTRLPPHRITALGIARTFQNQRCFNQMSVLENVLVGMHTPGARAEQRRARAEALELLGFFRDRLAPRAAQPAASLSYANRRRLEIARALAVRPRLLLLDEPAAGMNPSETQELMADIRRINGLGITILLIEHDMKLVRGICTRVVALDHGSKIAEGTFEQVQSHPAVLEAYLGTRAVAHA
jgi:ABC-type branched-subunit amino acid transport system ATPase component